MNVKDRERLRDLAKEQVEMANSDKMKTLVNEWYEHNDLKGKRPMILFDKGGVMGELMPDFLKCEDEEARAIEREFILNTISTKHFGDDSVVNPFFSVLYNNKFTPFSIEEKVERTDGIGHHFIPQISDLQEDFHKFKKSDMILDSKEDVVKRINYYEEIFGDILPVKHVGRCSVACLTQNIVHIMDMEDMYFAMIDYPELFKEMMEKLSNDYVEYFDLIEKNNLLMPTTHSERLGQGSYCFTKDLPLNEISQNKDTWIFMDSQETVSISPQMYEEFIFPYYKKISDKFGLFSYGCCEPVDPIWDNCLSKLHNLRKVSISNWCDEDVMGEKLSTAKTIYMRKPSANFLVVDRYLDEEAVRKHIRKTLNAARNCHLEIVQRDVPTIHGDISKLKRYIEIIREECSK